MVVGIMGAMPEEIEPILDSLDEYETIYHAANTYYRAEHEGHTLVIAYSKIGKVFAALSAATMIEKFGIEKLLFSGVAGAISSDLKVGDLIIASRLSQHDLDITAFGHPFGYVPEGSVYIESDSELNSIAKKVASEANLEVKEGVIATGDQFVANANRKEWIGKTFNADALEMEGASVAVVCNAHNVPFFILRAISDSADMDAGFDFDKFLESSAKISALFIMQIVKRLG